MLFNPKIVLGLALLFSVAFQPAHAVMNPLKFKGLHRIFKEKYEYVSPIYGSLSFHKIQNIRFKGNYGKKNETYPCLNNQIPKPLCPNDFTSAVIEQLFPSPDSDSLIPNQNYAHPLSTLKPSSVGKLLKAILRYEEAGISNTGKQKWIEETTIELVADLKPSVFQLRQTRVMKDIEEQIKLNRSRLQAITGENRDSQNTPETLALASKIQRQTEILRLKKEGQRKSTIGQIRGTNFWRTIEIFVNCIAEGLLENGSLYSKYESHIIEHSLLTFAMLKFENKSDILKVIQEIPFVVLDPKLLSESSEWIKDEYDLPEYLKIIEGLRSEFRKKSEENTRPVVTVKQAQSLSQDPELLAFILTMADFVSSEAPPVLLYKYATHSSLRGTTYSDCGETSLRNFFNFVTYDFSTFKFNFEHLPPTATRVIDFYRRRSSAFEIFDDSVRNDWSENVTSSLKDPFVNYVHPSSPGEIPVCGINEGLGNILAVLVNLLGDETLKKIPSNGAKLDHICEILSRPGFKLRWFLLKGDSQDVERGSPEIEIAFVTEQGTGLIWKIQKGHYVVLPWTVRKNDWRISAADAVALQIQEPGTFSINQFPNQKYFLRWLKMQSSFSNLTSGKPLSEQQEILPLLFLYLRNESHMDRLDAFKQIVQTQSLSYFPAALSLLQSFPMNKYIHQTLRSSIIAEIRAALQLGFFQQEFEDALSAWSSSEPRSSSPLLAVDRYDSVIFKVDFCKEICKNRDTSGFLHTRTSAADLSNRDLSCTQFIGEDLRSVNFSNSLLICADLANALLENTNFSGANILGIKLTGAKMTGAFSKFVPINEVVIRDARKDKQPVHISVRHKLNTYFGLYFLGDNLENATCAHENTITVDSYTPNFNTGLDILLEDNYTFSYSSF